MSKTSKVLLWVFVPITLFFLGFSILLSLGGYSQFMTNQDMRNRGVEMTGVVIDIEYYWAGGEDPRRYERPTCRYVVDGISYVMKGYGAERCAPMHYELGEDVALLYLPENPSVSILKERTESMESLVMMVMGLLFAVVCLAFLILLTKPHLLSREFNTQAWILKNLKKQLDRGYITQEEYEQEKKKLVERFDEEKTNKQKKTR